ncbi:hypothetical protein CH337_22580 [Rhodoblastus acidophilus]|nr:hypothetical protein CKO16_22480 [Rhodoblastus acidophilus]RAI16208.1 hypothetical protein CH337_22580 [Rhodoblastus acidophilus]
MIHRSERIRRRRSSESSAAIERLDANKWPKSSLIPFLHLKVGQDERLVRSWRFGIPRAVDRVAPWRNDQEFAALIGSLQRTLPLRRESEIGERALKRILEATGGVTAAIFSLMTRLAAAAVVSGEERIMGSDLENAKATSTLLGEAV